MSKGCRCSRVLALAIAAVMIFSVLAFAQEKTAGSNEHNSGEKVLAKVGGIEIKAKDVDAVIAQLPPQQAFMFNTDSGRDKILTELINRELFYIWSEENGVADNDDFKTDLERVRKSLMTNYAMQDLMKDINVSSDDVSKYYDEHKDKFVEQEQVRASHILVDSEDQAESILSLLKKGDKTFEDAATEFSKCPSKAKGGDLGFFSHGQMVKTFEDAAFSMKVGELSKPVKTEYGWHIIKVTEKKPSRQKELSEVRGHIKDELMGERQMKRYNETVETLKAKHSVEIMEKTSEDESDKNNDEETDKN